MKVAYVCEDPIYDQYIAGPVIRETLRQLGKPHANVQPVLTPKTRGFDTVITYCSEILDRYSKITDAVVFLIDLDCDDGTGGRPDKLRALRNALGRCDDPSKAVAVGARQELEVWALWGIRDDLPGWQEIRDHCDPKEAYFEPQLTKGDAIRPDGGRSRLVAASLQAGWQSLSAGCDELQTFRDDLSALIST